MTEGEANSLLDRFESNLFSDLYRSRWDAGYAAEVVPGLRRCLSSTNAEIIRRTLAALGRIGPEAQAAEADVVTLLGHGDAKIREAVVWTLGNICLLQPEGVVSRLIEAASDDLLLKPILFALIGFGRAARAAIPLLRQTFESKDVRLRLLSIRGLKAIDASFDEAREVLRRGLVDRSKEVRRSTEKLIASRWPERWVEVGGPPSNSEVIDGLSPEDHFDRTIAASTDKLAILAAEALAEDRDGLTEELDSETL